MDQAKNMDQAENVAQSSIDGPVGTGIRGLIPIIFLGFVAGLQLVDPGVANIALVSAARDLNMQGLAFSLASSISTLALAATVLPFGVLADRIGRRKVVMIAAVIAIIGDVIAAISPATMGYLVGRAIAGAGVGALLAASFAYVRFVSKPEKIGASLGIWNLSLIFVTIFGSLVGGALASYNWRIALLLVPALAVVVLILTPIILPTTPIVPGGKPDYLGMATIAIAMIAFLFGVAQVSHGFTNPAFFIPTVAGLILFGVYYVVETKVASPIFPPKLFASGIFGAAIVAGIAWNFAQGATQLQTSNYWQYIQHFSTSDVAVSQLAFMLAYGIFGVVVGRTIAPGIRTAKLLGAGYIVLTLGFILLGMVRPDTGMMFFLPLLFFMGLGLALTAVPQSVLFVSEAPPKFFGPVTSFRTTTGQLGYALGFALSTGLLSAFGTSDFKARLAAQGMDDTSSAATVKEVVSFIIHGTAPTNPAAKAELANVATGYTTGFDATMITCGVFIALLGVITMLLLVIGSKQKKAAQAAEVA